MNCPWCGSKNTTKTLVHSYVQDGKLILLFKHECNDCKETWNSEE